MHGGEVFVAERVKRRRVFFFFLSLVLPSLFVPRARYFAGSFSAVLFLATLFGIHSFFNRHTYWWQVFFFLSSPTASIPLYPLRTSTSRPDREEALNASGASPPHSQYTVSHHEQ